MLLVVRTKFDNIKVEKIIALQAKKGKTSKENNCFDCINYVS